jgi:microcystin-dependent protein
LGKSNWTSDPYFNGGISDFRIYNGALSSSEVTTLFNGYGSTLSTTNPTSFASYGSYNISSADADIFFVPGTMNAYLGTSDPDGWVICDGQPRTYNTKYQSLVNMVIGSFNGTSTYTPPDYRGYFLRGDNKGLSSNAKLSGYGSYSSQLKSYQSHSTPTHTHEVTMNYFNLQHNHNLTSNTTSGEKGAHQHNLRAAQGQGIYTIGRTNGSGGPEWQPKGDSRGHLHTFSCQGSEYSHKHNKNYIENNSADYETRPASLSINWCIKY